MSRRFLIMSGLISAEDDYAYVVLTVEDVDVLRIKLRHTLFERTKKIDSDLREMLFDSGFSIETYTNSPEMNIKEETKNKDDPERDEYVWVDDFLGGESWKELTGDQNIRGKSMEANFEEVAFTKDGICFYVLSDDGMIASSPIPYNTLEDT